MGTGGLTASRRDQGREDTWGDMGFIDTGEMGLVNDDVISLYDDVRGFAHEGGSQAAGNREVLCPAIYVTHRSSSYE